MCLVFLEGELRVVMYEAIQGPQRLGDIVNEGVDVCQELRELDILMSGVSV